MNRKDEPRIVSSERMLADERHQLMSRRDRLALNGAAKEPDWLGVACSGGGIRSGTFNLGVLQALSGLGLLPYIDYLSTVSGGGFLGTWLHGVIRNLGGGDPQKAT